MAQYDFYLKTEKGEYKATYDARFTWHVTYQYSKHKVGIVCGSFDLINSSRADVMKAIDSIDFKKP